MRAGIPQVVMPLAHDQFDNAARLKRLGLGDWIPVRKFTGPRLTEQLKRLGASPSVAASCRTAAERLAAGDGLRRAAAAIEGKVSRRQVTVP
jgi:UDP:flavonoid glycosyltransferase YjiC (YdhE family)